MNDERVLYDGPAQLPLRLLIRDIVLCFVGIGFFLLLVDWMTYGSYRVTVSNRRIVLRRGILTKRTETLDLFRVRDTRLETTFGFGTLFVFSTDLSTPVLALPIPGADRVFAELQGAVADARAVAGVRLLERA